ncbi:hypothetical protein BJ684DRAFT_18157, partial [Piptocephalis cylindrospora]
IPIWGKEEATDAAMAHILCQDSEFSIFPSNFTQLPIYHLVVELLRKDPARRLTLKALQRKSYFRSTLDTRVVNDLLKERLAIEDIDTDEESGAGTVMIPEEDDSIFINFSRIWSTNGWGRQISRNTLIESLKHHLAVDTTALKALDGFMDEFLPLSSEDDSNAAIGDPAFPKIASKCPLGSWILHQIYLKSQPRIYMIQQARQKIKKYLEEEPVYYLCWRHSMMTMTHRIRGSLYAIDSLSDIDISIRLRVVEAMDMVGYRAPTDDEEEVLRTLIRFTDEATQLSAKCASFIIYPGEEEDVAMEKSIRDYLDRWAEWEPKILEIYSGYKLKDISTVFDGLRDTNDTREATYFIQETEALQEEYKRHNGTEAGERYEKAFAGDVPSMLWLGEAYMDGDQGLEENQYLYCLWFLRAAIQNNPKALTYYGIASEWHGCSRYTPVLQYNCLDRAYSLGFLPAKAKYAWSLETGYGWTISKGRSEKIFQEAIDAGSTLGYHGLMLCCSSRNRRKDMILYGETCLDAGHLRCYSDLITSLLR